MTSKLLLRIAAIIMLLHALGHTLGLLGWNKPNGPFPDVLVKMMTDLKFDFMGKSSTVGSFYEGMGYTASIALLLIVALLWIVSGVQGKMEPFTQKVLIAVISFLILLTVDELIYFFPMAAAFSAVSALLAGIAFTKMTRSNN